MVSAQSNLQVICLTYGDTGWWLGRRLDNSASGWTPAAYLEEVKQAPPPVAHTRPPPPPAPAAAKAQLNGDAHGPSTRGKPTPPAPPAKRPAGRKPAPATPRDSGYSNGGGVDRDGAGTPSSQNGAAAGGGLAGGLAEALRARQKAMNQNEDADGDW